MSLPRRWNEYWFHPAPLLDLAVCRIVVVGFQLFCLASRDGVDQIHRLLASPLSPYDPLPLMRLLFWPLGDAAPPAMLVNLLGGVLWVSGVCALTGFRTRLSLGCFAGATVVLGGLQYSFSGPMSHIDALTILALLLLALSPCGHALAIDARRRGVRRREVDPMARWPLRLIQWLFALVYGSAALHKLAAGGLDWANGYTLQYYLSEKGLLWDAPVGLWVGRHHTLVQAMSWLTLWFEATFALALIVPRLTWWYLACGALFHLGIFVTMELDFSQYLALYAVFIPWGDVVERVHGLRSG